MTGPSRGGRGVSDRQAACAGCGYPYAHYRGGLCYRCWAKAYPADYRRYLANHRDRYRQNVRKMCDRCGGRPRSGTMSVCLECWKTAHPDRYRRRLERSRQARRMRRGEMPDGPISAYIGENRELQTIIDNLRKGGRP